MRTILLAGFLVGTLDIIAAIIVSGAGPLRVLQYVSSGVFGSEDAFAGGYATAAWGLAFHYAIAFTWTVIFFFLFPKMHARLKNIFVTGIVIGLLIWVGMNLVLVPLSNVSRGPYSWKGFFINASILIAMIGIPLSFIYSRYYFPKKN